MSIDRQLGRAVAQVPTVSVDGRYYRFTSKARLSAALDGSSRGGRWGPPGAFNVLYLTDDYEGCVIEAHRHASDDVLDVTKPTPANLALLTVDVDVTNIVDLRTARRRMELGLEPAILNSEPQASTGAAYVACSQIAQAAHQLGRHGLIVPSATQRGLTLALFIDRLPADQKPVRVGGVSEWTQMPADPRRLRMIQDDSGSL